MNLQRRLLICNIIAAVCAIWFLLTSWLWAYLANLLFSYPVGIIGGVFWWLGRPTEKKVLNKVVGWIFVLGVVVSLAVLIGFTISN
jgi:hypothetical protein